MRSGAIIVRILGVCSLVGSSAVSAQTVADHYYLSDVGGFGTVGYGVNDFGQVLFNSESGIPAFQNAAVWTPSTKNGTAGTRVELVGPPRTGPFGPMQPLPTFGYRINNFGQVAGTVGTYDSGFLWTPATAQGSTGTMTVLKPVANSSTTEAYGLNDRGDVTVWAKQPNFTYLQNYLYRPCHRERRPGQPAGVAGCL